MLGEFGNVQFGSGAGVVLYDITTKFAYALCKPRRTYCRHAKTVMQRGKGGWGEFHHSLKEK